MLLKQALVGVRPIRRASAVLPAPSPVVDRHPLRAGCDLPLDDAEMALRLGLRDFHARKREAAARWPDHRTVPPGHRGKADSSAV
jgi:hypothetical protein